MDLGIVADGGPDIGFGHLVRSGALASEFLRRDWSVTYLSWTPEAVTDVVSDPVSVQAVDTAADVVAEQFDVLLVDTYRVETDDQRTLRRRAERMALVEDRDRPVCCDVLVNGNVHAPALEYDWVGDEPEWCLGTDYLLLRKPFRDRAQREAPWRQPPERALVIMGGSDINDATPAVVRAFDGFDLTVDVTIGPGFTNRDEIATAAGETDATVRLRETPENLPELMFESDFAVSATGSTVYELLATDTPTIGLPQADNQEPIARELERRGALLCPDDDVDTRECIGTMTADNQLRRSIREAGSRLVDGKGTQRVYETLAGGA